MDSCQAHGESEGQSVAIAEPQEEGKEMLGDRWKTFSHILLKTQGLLEQRKQLFGSYVTF